MPHESTQYEVELELPFPVFVTDFTEILQVCNVLQVVC